MDERDKEEYERFRRITAQLGEQFGDFFVAVRGKGNCVFWKASDVNWAIGTQDRYKVHINAEDQRRTLFRDGGE